MNKDHTILLVGTSHTERLARELLERGDFNVTDKVGADDDFSYFEFDIHNVEFPPSVPKKELTEDWRGSGKRRK